MQKNPSQVSSGAIAPTVIGPYKDMKEVYILSGLVLLLAGTIGVFWYYSGQEQTYASKAPAETLTGAQVTNVLKTNTSPIIEPVINSQVTKPDSIHTDIYFELGRKGLTDDAKAILATQADLAKNDQDLGILVQGYTDQQGSATYNKNLGLMRAQNVKEYLVGLGVSARAIKVVSLGEEGILCLDTSDVCRNMNRRVHLEMRKVGKEHMIVPTVATEPAATDSIQAVSDQSNNTEDQVSPVDNLLPSLADPSATERSPLTTDPASGS